MGLKDNPRTTCLVLTAICWKADSVSTAGVQHEPPGREENSHINIFVFCLGEWRSHLKPQIQEIWSKGEAQLPAPWDLKVIRLKSHHSQSQTAGHLASSSEVTGVCPAQVCIPFLLYLLSRSVQLGPLPSLHPTSSVWGTSPLKSPDASATTSVRDWGSLLSCRVFQSNVLRNEIYEIFSFLSQCWGLNPEPCHC